MKTLTEIPNLKMLTLSNTSITDEGLLVLAGSANLNKLDIRNTKVTKNGLAEFSKLAKSCQVLSSVGGGGGGPPGGMKGPPGGMKGPPGGMKGLPGGGFKGKEKSGKEEINTPAEDK